MTLRYTNDEEMAEIIALYRTGKYSYQQIGEMKCLSKSTIINIVKGYPYDPATKETRYYRLQIDSAVNREMQIKRAEEEARKAYERGSFTAYGVHLERWSLLVRSFCCKPEDLYDYIKSIRTDYERRAWEAFNNGSYALFGYYAETWETLTEILGDNEKSPWRVIAVKINTHGHMHNVKFSGLKAKTELCNDAGVSRPYARLSDRSWQLIKPAIPGSKAGYGRDQLDGIIYALRNCNSLRALPPEFGSQRLARGAFAAWYCAGVFRDLYELASSCPEIVAVRSELLAIEMHRLVAGPDIVPRLSDIRKMASGGKLGERE